MPSWDRVLATGSYPPPKCASTLIDDTRGNLILFGGRSMVHIGDIHMREQLHHELHSYSMERNLWTLLVNVNEPGPICDHSASISNLHDRSRMIVFGGLVAATDHNEPAIAQRTNDLWQWSDVETNTWTKIVVEGTRPEPRKGQ